MERLDITNFDSVFAFDPKYQFPRDKLSEIAHVKNNQHGKTFYERLLEDHFVGQAKYPPKNNQELRNLHRAIIDSEATENQKQALIFYLLKCVQHQSDGHEVAENFAQEVHLARKSVAFIEGVWQFDHLHHREAIEIWCSSGLPPKYAGEVLHILLDHNMKDLAIAFYQTVIPPFSNATVLHTYFEALCAGSISDAYTFMHSQNDEALFEILLECAVTGTSLSTTKNPIELVDLPLTDDEESRLYDFFTSGQGKTLPHAADVVVMRKIATGKLSELEADLSALNVSTKPVQGISWKSVVGNISRGTGPRGTELFQMV